MPENFSQDLPASRSAPIVVGGTGGSGTRVVVALLRATGVPMGTNVNRAQDSLAFRPFNRKWIAPYLQHREGQLNALDPAAMAADFHTCLAAHSADLPSHPRTWGWKRPEAIHLLPFLHAQLPEMLFIHIIRNGLDMAFAPKQYDLPRYGQILLGRLYDHEPEPLRSLRLWMKTNTAAAHYGEREMGSRYLRVHYESLCAQPAETAKTILEFAGLSADPAALAALVKNPGSLGRWHAQPDLELLVRLFQAGKPALLYFGYWDEPAYQQFSRQLAFARKTLLPLKSAAHHLRHSLVRAARAARERRLLAALRTRLARWTR